MVADLKDLMYNQERGLEHRKIRLLHRKHCYLETTAMYDSGEMVGAEGPAVPCRAA